VPGSKQERKVRLGGFLKRVQQTRRTGWYLRVLTPGEVGAGDQLILESRPDRPYTIETLNENWHGEFDAVLAEDLLKSPELAEGWKEMLRHRLARHEG
jgi:MOSC domain-containing protein YiiM